MARAQLAREQAAHATRVSRIDAREVSVRGKERGHEEKEEELRAWHERLQAYEAEREWEHWRRDSMRKLQSEIERKVPSEEWRQRTPLHTLPVPARPATSHHLPSHAVAYRYMPLHTVRCRLRSGGSACSVRSPRWSSTKERTHGSRRRWPTG